MRESDLLSALVQSYTTTGRTRYLEVYYDILAVRRGEKGAAPGARRRGLLAQRGQRAWRTGRRRIGPARNRCWAGCRTAASPRPSCRAATDLLQAAEVMQQTEQVAFCGHAGPCTTRDRATSCPTACPDGAHAIELVHSPAYESARTQLTNAQALLAQKVQARTQLETDQARSPPGPGRVGHHRHQPDAGAAVRAGAARHAPACAGAHPAPDGHGRAHHRRASTGRVRGWAPSPCSNCRPWASPWTAWPAPSRTNCSAATASSANWKTPVPPPKPPRAASRPSWPT
jgi:hypothetical protein